MRPITMRKKTVLGAGVLVVATAAATLAVNGLITGPDSPSVPVPRAEPAAAGELPAFDDCEQLRQWYVDKALPEVGPYGFGYGPVYPQGLLGTYDTRQPVAGLARAYKAVESTTNSRALDAPTGQENSESGTNVQEVGVDEPDRAKTNGDLVVHVRRQHTLVVTDVTGRRPHELATMELPRRMSDAELLLDGDRLLVVGNQYVGRGGPYPYYDTMRDYAIPYVSDSTTRLLQISLADPADPNIESDQRFGGALVSAREYDAGSGDPTVRLVVRTGYPTLDFVQPNRNRTRHEARAENRRIVRRSTIDDWLPTVAANGDRKPLVKCTDVRHPKVGASRNGFGTLAIATLPFGDPTNISSTAVTARGDTVYSSTDRLYLATPARKHTTQVHAFALDGTFTSYAASGTVEGEVADRWRMDESGGYLRVAVAQGPGRAPAENGIAVLREDGDRLVATGTLRGLGPHEQIKSVRWFDDLAVVTTFRQIDPVYTVDLSDPDRPRRLGELEIPGFSSYLHPIADDRLVGLGQEIGGNETVGGQAALFDLSNLAEPRRSDVLGFGRHMSPGTDYDPRAFTWLPNRSAGLVAVQDEWNGNSTVREVRVGDDGTLAEIGKWKLRRWYGDSARILPLPNDRAALIGREVHTVALAPVR